jgi:hypothetical protein
VVRILLDYAAHRKGYQAENQVDNAGPLRRAFSTVDGCRSNSAALFWKRNSGRSSIDAEKPFGCEWHPIRHGKFIVKLRTHYRERQVTYWLVLAFALSGGAALCASQASPGNLLQQSTPPPKEQKAPPDSEQQKNDKDLPAQAFMPRGKKLCLTDGTFQIVRSYEKQGDSVRYYSVERSAWEEIPATLVDWKATAQAETDDAKAQKEFADKVKVRDTNEHAMEKLDVDASLMVAPSTFLPSQLGMFALAGKDVVPLTKNMAKLRTDKARQVEKVLSGVPMIPSRHFMDLKGKRAVIRIPDGELEFYYRIPVDEAEPDVELMRAQVKGDTRVLESISTDIVGENEENRKTVALLKWDVAKGVYRYTLSAPMGPGEYALTINLPDGLNFYVWDFGVDAAPAAGTVKKK